MMKNQMPFSICRLDHIQICIPVGEEDRAREFYSQVLGLAEIEKPDALKPNGGLWFSIADIQLHIGVESGTNNSKRHPAFEVDDLASARRHLDAHGVTIKNETVIPGIARFSFLDPFGNRIELLQVL